MLRPLNAPEAREPRTGRQPTTTEADVRPLRADFFIGLKFQKQGEFYGEKSLFRFDASAAERRCR